ncbi:MAG: hypothetical protein HQL12_05095, partial [Candidatus Omnitrophica bacterium]|nr:hypothetical protein [Candidatus Omnitrophota bacterium]
MNILLIDINKSILVQRIALLIVLLISLFFLICLEHTALPLTKDGVHFQEWSSDTMWQTLESSGLRKHPFKSLWYLHKQPPLYDAVRDLLIGCLNKVPDNVLLSRLDQLIYYVWAFIYCLMVVMVYQWLSQLTSFRFAFYLSMAWILHPAPIFYATYLDSPILCSLGVLWLFYELWLFYSKQGSIIRLSACALLLFYLRASCQWYFFFLLAGCLILMRIPRRQVVKFVLICMLLVAPYIAKQYCLFRVTGATFVGMHFYYLIAGDSLPQKEFGLIADSIPWTYPKEAFLSVGRWNTKKDWQESWAYHRLAYKYLKDHPSEAFRNIARTFFIYNWPDYWRPSATFEPNVAVSLLPWEKIFNQYLSYPSDFLILVLAFF